MYHVINDPPAGAPYPLLYVPAAEFDAQMQALKDAGWVGVTLDQLQANWTTGAKLPAGKPFVITFDNGYYSQYSAALPELKKLGWVADENMQLTGLPPSQGGLTNDEIRAMVTPAGSWTRKGSATPTWPSCRGSELTATGGRCAPHDPAALPRAGQLVLLPVGPIRRDGDRRGQGGRVQGLDDRRPGMGQPDLDPYTLPRLRIAGGTTPAALLSQISAAQSAPAPPSSYLTSSPGVG